MHVIVWQFLVDEPQREAFERAYGPVGRWVTLFRRSPGFLGTELLHDREEPRRYFTVDRWESAAAFAAFRQDHGAAYETLDRELEGLSSEEVRVGEFETVRNDPSAR